MYEFDIGRSGNRCWLHKDKHTANNVGSAKVSDINSGRLLHFRSRRLRKRDPPADSPRFRAGETDCPKPQYVDDITY